MPAVVEKGCGAIPDTSGCFCFGPSLSSKHDLLGIPQGLLEHDHHDLTVLAAKYGPMSRYRGPGNLTKPPLLGLSGSIHSLVVIEVILDPEEDMLPLRLPWLASCGTSYIYIF